MWGDGGCLSGRSANIKPLNLDSFDASLKATVTSLGYIHVVICHLSSNV